MTTTTKALIYVLLAGLIPVGEVSAVVAKKSEWPTQFELCALAVTVATQMLLALKMYYSDPTPNSKPTNETTMPLAG